MARSTILSLRISGELKARLDEGCRVGPYRVSKTEIVERGIVLALEEIKRLERAPFCGPALRPLAMENQSRNET